MDVIGAIYQALPVNCIYLGVAAVVNENGGSGKFVNGGDKMPESVIGALKAYALKTPDVQNSMTRCSVKGVP